ncbi:MAG TPA: PxxKW family cysteine-rich protein [Syntrophales bacterium]|nr:PxxKW family cysteine-rich protein [Syntrophales bacterium]HRT62713.1 PxxKW family cysteine-rich protein [Syntrophales bacterium]
MVCQTVKAGRECAFMTKNGCAFNGGTCHPIVEQCEGCARIFTSDAGSYCMLYPHPAGKWAVGGCASATHRKSVKTEAAQKLNPLKASKRSQKS